MTKSSKLVLGGVTLGLLVAGVVIFFITSRETQGLESLAAKFPNWIPVTGKLVEFDAIFPKEPKYDAQDIPVPNSDLILKQEVYTLEDNATRYTVSAVIYPDDIPGDEGDNLHDALLGMVKSVPGATLEKEERRSTLAGKPYIEFSIKSGDTLYRGKMLMASRTLLQLLVESPEKNFDLDASSYFINAFNTN
ncbi:MAG: hypothetical protein Q7S86_01910 [bacterium]|nr:hypothetical protein [bacterium]